VFRVQGSGFRVQGSGVRVQGSEFRVTLGGLYSNAGWDADMALVDLNLSKRRVSLCGVSSCVGGC